MTKQEYKYEMVAVKPATKRKLIRLLKRIKKEEKRTVYMDEVISKLLQ